MGKENKKQIDKSVGRLVWVRRQNGSWWPGQILDPNELPETSSSRQPRGTPIKLLAKDGANVDWYNLEITKRVKAFRCGKYDAYIKKAKASAIISSKRETKNAQRNEAIIEALELESAFIEKYKKDVAKSRKDWEENQLDALTLDSKNKYIFKYLPRLDDGLDFEKEKHSLGSFRGTTIKKEHVAGGRSVELIDDSIPVCSNLTYVYDLGKGKQSGIKNWTVKGKRKARSRKMYSTNKSHNLCVLTMILDSLLGKPGPISEYNGREVSHRLPLMKLDHARSKDSKSEESDPYLAQFEDDPIDPKFEESNDYFEMFGPNSVLFEVTVEANSNSNGHPVPFISPTSKCTGTAIVGHAVKVEALEKNSSNYLKSDSVLCCNRRLKLYLGPTFSVGVKKRPVTLKMSRKSKRRRRPRKTRRLSSLTSSPIDEEETRVLGRLSPPRTLACVPLNLVYSRLNAALS